MKYCNYYIMIFAIIWTLFPAFLSCGSEKQSNKNFHRTTSNRVLSGPVRSPENDGSRCPRGKGLEVEVMDTNHDNIADVRKVYKLVTTKEGDRKITIKILICREIDLNHDGKKDVFRFYNDKGRPEKELEDYNFDGVIDLIAYFENGKIVREELDRNGDGRIDEWRIYEVVNPFADNYDPYASVYVTSSQEESENTQPKLMRIEQDNNFDGRVDAWQYYKEGEIAHIGIDSDGDGRPDRWYRSEAEQIEKQKGGGRVPATQTRE